MTRVAGPPRGPYAFVITRPGAEALLKTELSLRHPGLRLSFSRPGLLTFKDPRAQIDARFGDDLVFARVAGETLGLPKTDDEAIALLAREPGPVRLHVFARDAEERGPSEDDVAHARSLEAAMAIALGARSLPDPTPDEGDRVIDVAVRGTELLVGAHVHSPGRWTIPGGRPAIVLPATSPSRAYLKVSEAIAWSGQRPRAGERALELGSAPGGQTLALLELGVSVIAVDPAAMDPQVLATVGPEGARAQHLAMPAGAVRTESLPAIDWLVVDLNLAPPVALRYIARIVRARRPRRGAFLTLKMNDAAAIERIDESLARVRGMGFSTVRATQLPANRTEITVHARP